MSAVFKRELRSYFNSMLGYVFLAIFLFLTGAMFYSVNIRYSTATMKGFFSIIISWVIFLLPVLTMRLFSEDRKLKTDQLLITAPITVWEMVLGKICAVMCVFLTAAAVMLLYPFIIAVSSNLPFAETVSCYIGFILLCSSILCIGAFMSSLTESQIVAAVSTYGILILMILMGSLAASVSNEMLSVLLLWLSPMKRFNDFTMGILDIEAVIYYLSIDALFVFLTITVYEQRALKR